MKTAITSTTGFAVGDVLVYEDYNRRLRAARVDDYTWTTVDGVRTKFYGVQYGEVKDNEFVLRKGDFSFLSEKGLREYSFNWLWTPDEGFRNGQFLKDQHGNVYFHKDADVVWRAVDKDNGEGSTWTSLQSWRNRGMTLSALETVAGKPFEDIVSDKISF